MKKETILENVDSDVFWIDPSSLKESDNNPNKHSNEQIDRLAKLITQYGWRHPIIVRKETGLVVAGHGRLRTALKMKWETVPVQIQSFKSDDDAYGFMVADNAIASWAELDLASVNLEVPNLGPDFDIDMLGLKDFAIDAWDKLKDKDEDHVPEIQKSTTIELGYLYSLGTHRLLCGDANNPDHVALLMNGEKADMVYTDPPYGMNLDTDYDDMYAFGDHTHTGNRFKKIEGDSIKYDPAPILAIKAKRHFIWGCDYFYEKLPGGGSIVAWDKRTENLDKVPGNTAEFCWALPPVRRTVARILWSGHFGMNGDDAGSRMHPTQKPIKLHEWFFDKWGKNSINIVDLYLGSGSTLIACEKMNRKCFGMEIDPQYCQVIIDRWEKFTGLKATRVD